jgi:AGCS family alanine or glycine:cation symporter
MQEFTNILTKLDQMIGGSSWFVYLLLGTGLFFTIYLVFPQVRYFKYAIKIVRGKFDREGNEGDTSLFQALTTALSGTVGTGNIAGVAQALHCLSLSLSLGLTPLSLHQTTKSIRSKYRS